MGSQIDERKAACVIHRHGAESHHVREIPI